MGSVFTATWYVVKFFDMVELVVPIGVGDPKEPMEAPTVADSVQGIKSPEQALGTRDRGRHLFDDGLGGPVMCRRTDAGQSLTTLIAGIEAALWVGGQRHPRPQRVTGDDKQPFNLIAGEDMKRLVVLGLCTRCDRRHSFRRLLPLLRLFSRARLRKHTAQCGEEEAQEQRGEQSVKRHGQIPWHQKATGRQGIQTRASLLRPKTAPGRCHHEVVSERFLR